MKKFIIKLISFIFWIAIWQVLYNWVDAKFLIASPFDVGINIFNLLIKAKTWTLIFHTVLRIMSGFILASLIGMCLGGISYLSRFLKELIDVIMSIIKIAPIVSFIIFALVYMKTELIVPFISFLMVLPIFYYATYQGFKNIDSKMIEMANIYEFNFFDKLKYIYLNGARKNLIAAIETGIGFAFKSGITAEILVLPKQSLGMMLYNSKIYLDGLSLISYTIILILISFIIEKTIKYIVRKVTRYE